MPKPTVYLETTVIGHLVGRLHPDPTVAGKQISTREWWATAADRFQLFASKLVVDECSGGDALAATERLSALDKLDFIVVNAEAETLAQQLISGHALPSTELRDALHISLAAVFGIEYLVTWNFKHIANPSTRSSIEAICREAGYEPSIICTPEALMEI